MRGMLLSVYSVKICCMMLCAAISTLLDLNSKLKNHQALKSKALALLPKLKAQLN